MSDFIHFLKDFPSMILSLAGIASFIISGIVLPFVHSSWIAFTMLLSLFIFIYPIARIYTRA